MSAEYPESLQDSARWLFDKEQELFGREAQIEAQEEHIAARETSVSQREEHVAMREERADDRQVGLVLKEQTGAAQSRQLDDEKRLHCSKVERHYGTEGGTRADFAQIKQARTAAVREKAELESERDELAEKLVKAAAREAELDRKLKAQGVEKQKVSFSNLKWD